MSKEIILVGLRTNLLDGLSPLRGLFERAQKDFQEAKPSNVYKSEGQALEQGWLAELWTVIRAETELPPMEVRNILGRWELEAKEPVADITFLSYGSHVLLNPQSPLPDPNLHRKRVFLQCAAEVEPHFIHPILGQSLLQLVNSDQRALIGEFFAQGRQLIIKA